jgi:hypothetical protein
MPNGALSSEFPPLQTRNGQPFPCARACEVRTDKVGDSLMIWRAHFGDTRDIVLWDSVLAGCNDRGRGTVCNPGFGAVDRAASVCGRGRLRCCSKKKRRGENEEREREDEGEFKFARRV